MRSLVLTQDGLRLGDTPKPSVMPGDVRVEVRAVGICETDLSIWRGRVSVNLPLILGHEIAGVVEESSVEEFAPGSLVITEAHAYCGRCWYCRNDMKALCTDRRTIGVTTDGGLAEYISVPADTVHVLPPSLDALAGTFVEPLSSAVQAYAQCPSNPQEVVVVIGSGKLGLLVAQVYDSFGAQVYVLGRNQWRLGLARQLGLTNTVDTKNKQWKKQILDSTSGVGPRIVVEATGSPEGLKMALDAVRSGGTIALKSHYEKTIDIDFRSIVERQISLQGSTVGSYEAAIDMLAKGRIEVKRLVSKEFNLEQGIEAFEYADKPGVAKVVVRV